MEKKKSSNPLRGFWGLCLVLIASLLFFTACEQNHDEKATITKLADLSGKKVAVLNGTNIPALLVKEVPGIQCQIYPDNASALQALDKDEVSAVAGDALVLSRAMQGEMEGHFLDESLPQEQYVFAVTKDNLSLAGAIDDTILSCKDTGIYMDMVEPVSYTHLSNCLCLHITCTSIVKSLTSRLDITTARRST